MAVERTGDHHAQHMYGGFRVPAPARGFEDAPRARRQVGEISLADRLGRNVRMDVDWHIELFRRGEDLVEARVIEEAAFGRAMHHGADKSELLDRA